MLKKRALTVKNANITAPTAITAGDKNPAIVQTTKMKSSIRIKPLLDFILRPSQMSTAKTMPNVRIAPPQPVDNPNAADAPVISHGVKSTLLFIAWTFAPCKVIVKLPAVTLIVLAPATNDAGEPVTVPVPDVAVPAVPPVKVTVNEPPIVTVTSELPLLLRGSGANFAVPVPLANVANTVVLTLG